MSPDIILGIQIMTKLLVCWGACLFLGTVSILLIWNLLFKGKFGHIENLLK